MVEIERIEEWKGQDVVDPDGEKIGKLEDVLFEVGSREPIFGCVKTGLFGRHLSLVPLEGATLSRDHLRVLHSKDRVKDGPRMEGEGALAREEELALSRHYDLESGGDRGDGPRYESGSARAQREARTRQAEGRAAELDQLAERRGSEAGESERRAEEAREEAQRVEEERDQARQRATEARKDAGGGPGSSGVGR